MANPRDDVIAAIVQTFPREDPLVVLALLDTYGTESAESGRSRVQQAILTLSDGDPDRLLHFLQAAKEDYRDVLWWAEYPEAAQSPARNSITEMRP